MPAKYSKFKTINGVHPFRKVYSDGYIDYPARYRNGGRVIYFNFALAKELGLISKTHPKKMNDALEEAILKAFAIQIINEYDWMNKSRFPKDGMEERLYMATRYLQIQHENKQGLTSGDGRSIWNGFIKTPSKTFDVSSCGTGTTVLSPGVSEAGKFVETGNTQVGYASGLADTDEMLSGAIMSEIFYKKGLPTERCLTVIEFKDKTAIGVRTAPNLIRPAHFFRYLKMSEYEPLKKTMDYFLEREARNRTWKLPDSQKKRYSMALENFTKLYSRLAAIMEEEYIFNWLSWDGDNMLASGAILDYGSIRQFAAKHSKYRYEDVDRFSTSLKEQRVWARKIIQTFIQLFDYLLTKEKKSLESFADHKMLDFFDEHFEEKRLKAMLWRVGFENTDMEKLLARHRGKVEDFQKVLNYFEEIKTSEGQIKVPDGINHPPVFLVRNIMRELPKFFLRKYDGKRWPLMDEESFCLIMAASYVEAEDLQLNDYRQKKAVEFQRLYLELVRAVSPKVKSVLNRIARRASVINYEFRSTGDGLTWIVNEAVKVSGRLEQDEFQEAIDRFIDSQVLVPGKWKPIRENELKGNSLQARLLRKMQENLEMYSESI